MPLVSKPKLPLHWLCLWTTSCISTLVHFQWLDRSFAYTSKCTAHWLKMTSDWYTFAWTSWWGGRIKWTLHNGIQFYMHVVPISNSFSPDLLTIINDLLYSWQSGILLNDPISGAICLNMWWEDVENIGETVVGFGQKLVQFCQAKNSSGVWYQLWLFWGELRSVGKQHCVNMPPQD